MKSHYDGRRVSWRSNHFKEVRYTPNLELAWTEYWVSDHQLNVIVVGGQWGWCFT